MEQNESENESDNDSEKESIVQENSSVHCDNMLNQANGKIPTVSKENTNIVQNINISFADIENSIIKFSGELHQDINEWISHFESMSHLFNLTELQKFIFAKKAMLGNALLFVRSEPLILSYEKLKEALVAEFSFEINSANLHEILSKRKIRDGESIQEYFFKIKELCSNSKIEDAAIMHYIIQGINDRQENKNILYGCKNLLEFKEKLKVYELIKRDSVKNKNTPVNFKPRYEHNNKSNVKFENVDRYKVRNELYQNNSRNYENRGGNKYCFNCGDKNHISKYCTNKSKGFKCFRCNCYGHKSSECTGIDQKMKVDALSITVQPNLCKIINIENLSLNAVIDTGSQITVLRKCIFEKLNVKQLCPFNSTLKGIGKCYVKPLGFFRENIRIDDFECNAVIYVVENDVIPHDAIVGLNVLMQADTLINENGITIKNKTASAEINFLSVLPVDDPLKVNMNHSINKKCKDEAQNLILNYTSTKTPDTVSFGVTDAVKECENENYFSDRKFPPEFCSLIKDDNPHLNTSDLNLDLQSSKNFVNLCENKTDIEVQNVNEVISDTSINIDSCIISDHNKSGFNDVQTLDKFKVYSDVLENHNSDQSDKIVDSVDQTCISSKKISNSIHTFSKVTLKELKENIQETFVDTSFTSSNESHKNDSITFIQESIIDSVINIFKTRRENEVKSNEKCYLKVNKKKKAKFFPILSSNTNDKELVTLSSLHQKESPCKVVNLDTDFKVDRRKIRSVRKAKSKLNTGKNSKINSNSRRITPDKESSKKSKFINKEGRGDASVDSSVEQPLSPVLSGTYPVLTEQETASIESSSSDIDIIDENVEDSVSGSFLHPWSLPFSSSVDSPKALTLPSEDEKSYRIEEIKQPELCSIKTDIYPKVSEVQYEKTVPKQSQRRHYYSMFGTILHFLQNMKYLRLSLLSGVVVILCLTVVFNQTNIFEKKDVVSQLTKMIDDSCFKDNKLLKDQMLSEMKNEKVFSSVEHQIKELQKEISRFNHMLHDVAKVLEKQKDAHNKYEKKDDDYLAPFKKEISKLKEQINNPKIDNDRLKEMLEAEFQANFENQREELRKQAKRQIFKVQEENRRTYNLRRKEPRHYKINDLVAIKRTQFGPHLKLKSKFFGPYKIVKVKGGNTYDVEKIGHHEGPNCTSTCAEFLKPWMLLENTQTL